MTVCNQCLQRGSFVLTAFKQTVVKRSLLPQIAYNL